MNYLIIVKLLMKIEKLLQRKLILWLLLVLIYKKMSLCLIKYESKTRTHFSSTLHKAMKHNLENPVDTYLFGVKQIAQLKLNFQLSKAWVALSLPGVS